MDTLDVNYVASAGTTTNSPNNTAPSNPWATQGSTGLFWWYRSYGIRDITDGTSNTVAFSEALVTNGGSTRPPRRSPTPTRGTRSQNVAGAGGAAQQYDANANPAAILAGLNACNTAFALEGRASTTSAGSSGRSARSG